MSSLMIERKPKNQHDLGSGPVMGTLFRMSLPAIGMMFLNTLVFLVDSIYVSWLGEAQMAAMSISLPIAITFFAFMEGAGGGTTALVGQSLGRGNRREARLISISGLVLAYALSLLTLPLLLRGASYGILNALGAMNNPDILEPAYAYNFWWPLMAPFISYTFIGNSVFRCQGDTVTPLITLAIANIVNVILDPIFIFVFGWGIAGAAVATLVGRICACAFLFCKMKRSSGLFVPIAPFYPKPRRSLAAYWGKITAVGFPVTLSTGSVAIGFGWLNTILAGFGNHAVAAVMMCIRIEDFAFTVIIGVCSALTPFLAFNYGRRDLQRMIDGIKAAAVISGCIMLAMGSILFIFPHAFIALFRPSEATADLTALAIRISISAYPFTITQFIMGSFFVATGHSAFGTASQVIRSLLVRIPAAWFFAGLWGERGIWWFQPASWFFGAAASWIFSVYLIRKIRNELMLKAMKGA